MVEDRLSWDGISLEEVTSLGSLGIRIQWGTATLWRTLRDDKAKHDPFVAFEPQ